MPRIREYTSTSTLNTGPAENLASAQKSLAGAQMSRGQQDANRVQEEGARKVRSDLRKNEREITTLKAVVGGAQGITNALEAYNERSDMSKLTKGIAQTRTELAASWNDTITKADPDDDKIAERFLTDTLEPAIEKLGEGINSRRGRETYGQAAANIRSDMFMKTTVDVSSLRGANAVNSIATYTNQTAQQLSQDPTGFRTAIKDVDIVIGGNVIAAGLDREKSLELIGDVKNQLARAAFQGTANLNPRAALADLANGKYADYFDATDIRVQKAYAEQALEAKDKVDLQGVALREAKMIFNSGVSETEALEMIPEGPAAAATSARLSTFFAAARREKDEAEKRDRAMAFTAIRRDGKTLEDIEREAPELYERLVQDETTFSLLLLADEKRAEDFKAEHSSARGRKLNSLPPEKLAETDLYAYKDELTTNDFNAMLRKQNAAIKNLSPDGGREQALLNFGYAEVSRLAPKNSKGKNKWPDADINRLQNEIADYIEVSRQSGHEPSPDDVRKKTQSMVLQAYVPATGGFLGYGQEPEKKVLPFQIDKLTEEQKANLRVKVDDLSAVQLKKVRDVVKKTKKPETPDRLERAAGKMLADGDL